MRADPWPWTKFLSPQLGVVFAVRVPHPDGNGGTVLDGVVTSLDGVAASRQHRAVCSRWDLEVYPHDSFGPLWAYNRSTRDRAGAVVASMRDHYRQTDEIFSVPEDW